MSQSIQRLLLPFLIVFSISGLATTLALGAYSAKASGDGCPRKPLIGLMFIIICMSGIVAVFFPRKCFKTFGTGDKKVTTDPDENKPPMTFKGHHPSCGRFSAHVLNVGRFPLCAACTGLFLGAMLAISGSLLYFFGSLDLSQVALQLLLVGEAGIILGFAQIKLRGYLRSSANAFFVFAAFLILAALDAATENLLVDLYAAGIVVLWLVTRISISEWNNRRICAECGRCENAPLQG